MDFKVWKLCIHIEILHCALYAKLSDTNTTKPMMYYTCKYGDWKTYTFVYTINSLQLILEYKFTYHIFLNNFFKI
jgi:hypothetical protein